MITPPIVRTKLVASIALPKGGLAFYDCVCVDALAQMAQLRTADKLRCTASRSLRVLMNSFRS